MTFPLVLISSTLEFLASKKRLRRILHKAVKITLTPFSKILDIAIMLLSARQA